MAHIFISYSRVDHETTERLVGYLRRIYGLSNVWYDDQLPGGVHWWAEILRQIDACDVFVYLLSNESVTSPFCHAEFTEARRLQKPIVTVQLRDRTNLAGELSDIQYVDMKQGIDGESIARLIGSIQYQLEQPKKRRALWIPATALPGGADPHTTANRPDVETPTLRIERPGQTRSGSGSGRSTPLMVGLFALLVVIVVISAFALNSMRGDSTPTPDSTTIPSEMVPLVVAQPTETFSPTEPLDYDSLAATYDAQQTQTRSSEQTLTATHLPPTATPQHTATFDAFLTQRAAATAAQRAIGATLTADLWTDTPTVTLTSTNTPIPLGFPGSPLTSNDEWQQSDIDQYARTINGIEMVLVPAGCFRMGNDPEAYDAGTKGVGDGGEQCFDAPFYISRTEITNAQFDQLGCTADVSTDLDHRQRPRANVKWFESQACVAHIQQQVGGEWRLPTEAEWEYAARGPDDLLYPWGNDWHSDNLIWSDNSGNHTWDVGSKPSGASWVGAQDMAGNVWEWTSTLYSSYPYDAADGRENPDDASNYRVLRGGSWLSGQGNARAASRGNYYPNFRNYGIGFRLVVSSPIS